MLKDSLNSTIYKSSFCYNKELQIGNILRTPKKIISNNEFLNESFCKEHFSNFLVYLRSTFCASSKSLPGSRIVSILDVFMNFILFADWFSETALTYQQTVINTDISCKFAKQIGNDKQKRFERKCLLA